MRRTSIVLIFLLILASSASADIYKYTDENGVVCYTDAPFGKKTQKVLKENTVVETKAASDAGDYSHYVRSAATKYEIEPELIQAVIRTESNGNHRAVS